MQQTKQREQVIEDAHLRIGNIHTKEWLTNSSLDASSIQIMLEKFSDEMHIFRAIRDFTPEEVFELNPKIISTYSMIISEIRHPMHSLKLNDDELNLAFEKLCNMTRKFSSGTKLANSLLVALKGTEEEKEFVREVTYERESAPHYKESVLKISQIANYYRQKEIGNVL
ncbi:hypothetical protein K08M3_49600 [Vibrio alginolyticus]|uniref:Uncharacterized protein n=1 Tax=Vibrio alginolyticus TaxID=663 RepID=A0A1W6UUT1_VIBAL|nr:MULTISPECIES: hypothetical protein [Vibrio harveyi group]ARP06470.1 hypothetical protein K04M1_49470 [Vibrio alginolyticus]ARP11575.1 hypothetical protein K04M3_50060 [Vibrio alginolyticus]ARP16656.1 hypothetical protein K04M5_50040 [Vibrio alginolyticus]ARP21675.1 hypothetical protein K05K4_49660 [Vibrio alginolyticus]ARP26756.1 hypothetical protein K06K5_49560 [Vibrio alginolyticus]